MLELRAFGTIDLRAEDGSLRSILTQPKRVGLLAYLALARPHGYQRRDTLLAMFWPEVDQTHARSALSQSLWFLRRALPPGVLVSRGTGEVGVDGERTWCDVSAFEEAVAAGRWADALDLYRGELLGGFHVGRTPEFERWLDTERERLREMAASAAWSLANARLAAGRLVEAERAAQRALLLLPTDESPVRAFVEALACAGDRAAALRFYRKFTDLLKDQLDIGPCPESVAVVEALRNGDTATAALAEAGHELPETGEHDALPSTEPAQTAKRRLHWLVGAIAAISALVIAYGLGMGPTRTTLLGGSGHGVQSTVAVLPFSVRGSDRLSYLREGIVELLSTDLQRWGRLRAVAPHAVLHAVATDGQGTLSPEAAEVIAERLEAGLFVLGGVVEVGGRVRLTASLYDHSHGPHPLATRAVEGDAADALDLVRRLAGLLDAALPSADDQR